MRVAALSAAISSGVSGSTRVEVSGFVPLSTTSPSTTTRVMSMLIGCACLEVDIGPAQPARLTAAQTSRREVPHVSEPVLGKRVEEPFDLDGRERLHLRLTDRQAVDEGGHVVVDLALRQQLVQPRLEIVKHRIDRGRPPNPAALP